jgi:enamine deaminase RidA (YjgF/YER057c/UK114 family)
MHHLEFTNPSTMPAPVGNYTQVVSYGPLVWISGQVGLDLDGSLVGEADPEAQTRQIYLNIERALESVGGTLDCLVKTVTYVVGRDNVPGMMKVRGGMLESGKITRVPASVLLIVDGLQDPSYLVEVDATAVVPSADPQRRPPALTPSAET